MIKFRMYFDKDKETKWLNEMAARGLAMTGFCAGFYMFEKCEPGKYFYQIDITEGFFRVSENYREFMKETGVEIICLWGPWVFLRRMASDGPFQLYTDVESTIEHYTKIQSLFKIVSAIEIVCLTLEIIGGLRGSMAAWGAACLIAAFVIVLIRELIHVNEILAELKGRLGKAEECGLRRHKRPSGVLVAGMLINACGLMIDDPAYEYVRGFLMGFAMVLMLVGIFLTFRNREHG